MFSSFQKFPFCTFENQTPDLFSVSTVLPLPEFHINEIMRHLAFCVWLLLLRIMYLRSTQIVVKSVVCLFDC